MYFLFMLEYRGPNSVYFRILRGQTFAKMKKYLEFAKVSSREISSPYYYTPKVHKRVPY